MPQMNHETIRYQLDDGIATIVLSRPDKLNAFSRRMRDELLEAFDAVDADDDVRAVIVTGEGRAFCSGADLSDGAKIFERAVERHDADPGDESMRDGGGRLTLRIFECLKPVIAAVNGAAVGVGATMQLAMDIRLASVAARFGFVFARRGLTPEAASSWFLPRIVGIATALEWCYSGRLLTAQEALDGRLIRSIHEPHDLLPAARSIAREIADNCAPVSIALTRQLLWRMLGANHPMEAHCIDSRAIVSRAATGDVREGVAAFLEKRRAHFTESVSEDMPDFFPWWPDLPYR